MSSYHGWTHRPKAQGGTDPIAIPTVAAPALFRLVLHTAPFMVTAVSTWTNVVMRIPASLNRDYGTASEIVSLDGFTTGSHSGTEVLWKESVATDVNIAWHVGCRVTWKFGATSHPGYNGPWLDPTADPLMQYQLSMRLRRPDSSTTILEDSKFIRPGGPGGNLWFGQATGTPFQLTDGLTLFSSAIIDPSLENATREDFDDGIGPYPLVLQVSSTIDYDTDSAKDPPALSAAEFWGTRLFRADYD